MIEQIIIFIAGAIVGSFFKSIGEDIWKYLKQIFKFIKDYFVLVVKTKKIYNEY